LSREVARRTSTPVPSDLFDRKLRSMRRDRAARIGVELFLLDRAFDECLDRLRDIPRRHENALLLGCPSPKWAEHLSALAARVDVRDPGALFATAAGGLQADEDRYDFGIDQYDLCVAIGTLDSINELPLALAMINRALKADAPMIGAIAGGNSFPALRSSLIEAGRCEGRIIGRVHPRIDAATLAPLLSAAGFDMPVVDLDRILLRYPNLDALIRDLRRMGATSILAQRPLPMTRTEIAFARKAFAALAVEGRTEETVEILHFLAWSK